MILSKLPESITPRQEAAIVALINEPTVLKAAQSAKVGERTLHRWLHEPVFANAYRDMRRGAFNQAISLTQRYAAMAVQVLATVMADKTAPHQSRVAAATAVLKFGRESIELDDLVARIEMLETTAAPAKAQAEAA